MSNIENSVKELELMVGKLLTIKQAAAWAAQHQTELSLLKSPTADTLKQAALQSRLIARRIGDLWVTSEPLLSDYLRGYSEKETVPKRLGGKAGARGRVATTKTATQQKIEKLKRERL